MNNRNLLLMQFLLMGKLLFCTPFEGYTLFTPMGTLITTATTYLMDNDENIIHSWTHERGPASMPYLLQDSTLIYPFRVEFPTMEAGGVGGGVQKQNWEGEILWEYIFSDEQYQHHHDVEPLPNGNVLILVWENKSAADAFALGREVIDNPLNEMWSTAILELEPISGEIVWEWHIWDHLIQDFDPELPNYGVIAEHPELFDINCGDVGNAAGGPMGANGDWMHINSLNYNPELDQIIMSSRLQNELFIIDHSTTSEEAAAHSGGYYGKGGDFLYRWGNPQNYGRGTEEDRILGAQHSVNFIPGGTPGEGNIILFNNLHSGNTSAVIEFSPPYTDDYNYQIDDDSPYGPSNWIWEYGNDISTPIQGGAFRLPNGNTIITQTHTATLIEVNTEGEVEWQYSYQNEEGSFWIARAQKYSLDYLINSLIGDLNQDGTLNILDIVLLANIILNNDPYEPQGDLNADGSLNILDIVQLANLILNS